MKKLFTNLMAITILFTFSANIFAQELGTKQFKADFQIKNSKEDAVLTYYNTEDTSYNCLGAPGMLFMMVNRFTATELANYDGYLLQAVGFILADIGGEDATTDLTDVAVYVYQGGNYTGSHTTNSPGNLIKKQDFNEEIAFNDLNVLEFNTPIAIDAGQELWIGVSAKVSNGYPLAADLVTNFDDKGNVTGIDKNGSFIFANVNQFMEEGSTFDGDYAIFSYISGEAGEVGIETLSFTDVVLYPNPAKEQVRCINAENSQISIYDLTGKLVNSVEKATVNQLIDVSNLTQGIYFVKIEKEGKLITKKLNIVK